MMAKPEVHLEDAQNDFGAALDLQSHGSPWVASSTTQHMYM